MAKKYIMNPNSKTLHIIGKCRHTSFIEDNWKQYDKLDAVIADKGEYFKKCKLCFENE